MPRLTCPGCKTTTPFDEDQRGQIVSCAECRKKLRIPAKSTIPAAAQAQAKPSARTGALGRETRSRTKPPPPANDDVPEMEVAPLDEEEASKKAVEEPAPATRKKPAAALVADEDEDEKPKKKKKKKRRRVSTTTGVVSGLGGLVFLGVLILIVSGRWMELVWDPLQRYLESQGIHPIVAISVTGVIMAIPATLLYVSLMKSSVLEAMPEDLEFRTATLEKFRDLDEAKLDKLSSKIEKLGFTRLTDYTVKADIDLPSKGFARLFVHEEEHVFAEINQAFLDSGGATPMRCTFVSFLEDGWSVSVTDRVPSKESYLMRRPQAVWRSLPSEAPSKLFEEVLDLRAEMEKELDIAPLTDDTADAYFDHERHANLERKDVVRARWALGIAIELWLFERSPKREWLGDFAGK